VLAVVRLVLATVVSLWLLVFLALASIVIMMALATAD